MLKRLRMQMLRIRHVDASGESQSNVAINQRERRGEGVYRRASNVCLANTSKIFLCKEKYINVANTYMENILMCAYMQLYRLLCLILKPWQI